MINAFKCHIKIIGECDSLKESVWFEYSYDADKIETIDKVTVCSQISEV